MSVHLMYPKPHVQISPNFQCMLFVAENNAIVMNTLWISVFVSDITLGHSGQV